MLSGVVLMTLVCHTAVLQSLTLSDPFSQYSLESLWGLGTIPQRTLPLPPGSCYYSIVPKSLILQSS